MKKRYKISTVVCSLGAAAALAASLLCKEEVPKSVTIIGGSDGPTKTFIAGKQSGCPELYILAGGLAAVAVASLLIGKKKRV